MESLLAFIYQRLVKPVLFLFPADNVHSSFLLLGDLLGRFAPTRAMMAWFFRYKSTKLEQRVCGVEFANPIGLSAGFDYNADLVNITPSIGFGFHTIGTITNLPYKGNTPPMLGRLPKSRSLLVNKGFKNEGMKEILKRTNKLKKGNALGMSIGSTNMKYANTEEMIADVVNAFRLADQEEVFDYFELNISCPNLDNLKNLPVQINDPEGLQATLSKLSALHITRPVLIKMPAEKSLEDIERLVVIATQFPLIKGLIFSNLVHDRSNPAFDKSEIAKAGKGNFSGKPTEQFANRLIEFAYKKYGQRFVIVGCGGVFTAEDAYRKIKLGATLIQLITGMVYMGPQQIGAINRGLVRLLEKDGYSNISQAIGKT